MEGWNVGTGRKRKGNGSNGMLEYWMDGMLGTEDKEKGMMGENNFLEYVMTLCYME